MITDFILDPLLDSIEITAFVFIMMVAVEYFNIIAKGKLSIFTGKAGFRQYFLANLIGVTPGCFGPFTNVSLYMHGLIGFGALTGSMIASAGDEAFVIIARLGWMAWLLFGILFILGLAGSYLSDFLVKRFKIEVAANCNMQSYHATHEREGRHFLIEHIWNHIIKKHLTRIFLWTFAALLLVHSLTQFIDLQNPTQNMIFVLLIVAAVIGLIPDSGPHLIFVTLFADGVIPFSVLLTSSMVQDGHGMLPMFSFSVKDSLVIKGFNFGYGLVIGILVFLAGY